MFKLYSGSLTKTYDVGTDRLIYTINGEAEVNSLSLTLANAELNSREYVLPFTSNMTVVLKSGNKLTMNQTAALLPSVSVTIEKNAELVVPKNQSMYIYDVDEWGPYCVNNKKFVSVPYSPSPNRYVRKETDLVDAKIDVNGTLTAAGSVYTTQSGANICSSEGGGRFVQQNAPGREKTTYQVTRQASLKPFTTTAYADIPITPAQLQNAAGAPTLTKDAVAKDTFTYCKCQECGGKWVKNLKVAAIGATEYDTLKKAVTEFPQDSSGNTYIKMLHSTTEDITADRNLYLDLHGYTVTGDFNMAGHTLYGMDSSASKDYVTAPSGKIVGKVAPYAKTTYQTPAVDGEYDRYVAILGAENGTPTLSFHRFNISVSGYRFELAAPQCALFFIGKFQGDEAAKDYLTSLGITLKDNIDGTTKNFSCAKSEFFSKGAQGENSTVDISKDGAYLFEAYLMHDIDKENYQTKFSAIAHATFKNSGNSEDNSLSSVERNLSFKEAWEDALKGSGMVQKDKDILTKFLNDNDLSISNP